jgi:hypothetical protein
MERLNQRLSWRKSSRSNANNTDCVEVAKIERAAPRSQNER